MSEETKLVAGKDVFAVRYYCRPIIGGSWREISPQTYQWSIDSMDTADLARVETTEIRKGDLVYYRD